MVAFTEKNHKIHTDTKDSILSRKSKARSLQYFLLNTLQNLSNKSSMILREDQTYRSMKWDKGPRNKPTKL